MCEVINDELHLDHMEIRDAQEGKEHATQMMPRRLSAQSVEQYGCRKLKADILFWNLRASAIQPALRMR